MIITTLKVKLKPNNKQNSKLFACAGVSRWAYNYAVAKVNAEHKNSGKFINHYDIRKELTQLKRTEFAWLYEYSNNITKIAIKDVHRAFEKFFKKQGEHPRFHSKKKTKPSFGQDNLKIKFTNRYVQLEKVGYIRLIEKGRIPTDVEYYNPRVSFDGLNWHVTVGVKKQIIIHKQTSLAIGVDLGIKNLAVVSDGRIFKNVDISKTVKKLKHLQRIVARKFEHFKKGGSYKRRNFNKTKRRVLIAYRRLTNIRNNQTHLLTTSLVRTKPEFIAIEDLNVAGMMKNHCLARSIQEQTFGEIRRQFEYKCNWNEIPLKIVGRFYPSSQLCSGCKSRQSMPLEKRLYICPSCGLSIDRDLNAAINLRNYTDS